MNLSYRQLQTELKTLRDKGLVEQDLKLNAPKEELVRIYQDCLNRQERKQTLDSPLLIVWLVAMCLGLGVGLIWLGLKVMIMMVKATGKLDSMLANLPVWTDVIMKLQNIFSRRSSSYSVRSAKLQQ